jgi:hypothetical protein
MLRIIKEFDENVTWHNPGLGLTTKARVCTGESQE